MSPKVKGQTCLFLLGQRPAPLEDLQIDKAKRHEPQRESGHYPGEQHQQAGYPRVDVPPRSPERNVLRLLQHPHSFPSSGCRCQHHHPPPYRQRIDRTHITPPPSSSHLLRSSNSLRLTRSSSGEHRLRLSIWKLKRRPKATSSATKMVKCAIDARRPRKKDGFDFISYLAKAAKRCGPQKGTGKRDGSSSSAVGTPRNDVLSSVAGCTTPGRPRNLIQMESGSDLSPLIRVRPAYQLSRLDFTRSGHPPCLAG